MRAPQIIVLGFDEWIAKQLRAHAAEHRWLLHDLRQANAVRTRSPVLALIAQEYLHHDIVLQRAQLRIGFDEWDRWWQADPDLRTIILANRPEVG